MEFATRQERDEFIESHMKLAYSRASKFSKGKTDEDLKQIAMIGLIKAADAFDPNNGAKFGTFATRCIDTELFLDRRNWWIKQSIKERDGSRSHISVLSLNAPLCEGEKITLQDTIGAFDNYECYEEDDEFRGAEARVVIEQLIYEARYPWHEKALRLLAKGLEIKDVAEAIGKSRTAVYKMLKQLKREKCEDLSDRKG